jgi:signal transduction histidine kinase
MGRSLGRSALRRRNVCWEHDHLVNDPSALGTFLSVLASGTADVRTGVATILGDPGLEIAYWLPEAEGWIAADGARRRIDADADGVTVVERRGQRIAALVHDPARGPRGLSTAMRDAIALSLENERLQVALRGRLEEQQALRRVATAVARQHEAEEVFDLVTREVARHLDADAAMTARFDGPGLATVLSDWARPGVAGFPTGKQITIGGPTALAKIQATSAPVRVDSYEGMPGDYPAELRALGVRASVAAPVIVDGRLWGAVAAASVDAPFTSDTEARLGAFAELVGQAIANVDARQQLTASRARIVEATDETRRRIERDLHDGAQQRLVALALSLRMVARSAEPETAAAVEACIDELHTALDELRELARGIHPVVLTERGLEPALHALASRSPVPVRIVAELDQRLPPAQEAALYYVAAEALTNVAKHAQAGATDVRIDQPDGWAELTVTDDGVGGAAVESGSGLRGLVDRLDALGGRIAVTSAPGRGTTVRARVPIRPASPAARRPPPR